MFSPLCLFLAQGMSLSFVHVLIIYTEDQAAQNDGKLSHPIYFLFEVSNARADQGFFDANAETLSRTGLAAALRNILISGPSKTTRAPMIVGPTNSGKSTLVLPFDTLWIWASVSQASPWIVFRPSEHLEGETLSLLGRFPPCGVRPKDSAGHYLLEPFPARALRGPGFPILQ